MQGRFRYILDDFYELSNEPEGWEETEIVVKRNDDYGGLFLSYMTEYSFWGDGFDYIYQQIKSIGYCVSIRINITYQCSSDDTFETVFNGFINIKSADVDIEKCTVKANIELDDIYSAFLKQSSTKLNLGSASVYFPDGTFINPNIQNISYHAIDTGSNTINVPTDNRAGALTIVDAFNVLTRMYTQNQLTVISDFYTLTHPLTEQWEITLSGVALKGGDSIEVVFRNYFGITITKTQAFLGSEAATLAEIGLKLINTVSTGFGNIQRSQVQQYFDSTAFANMTLTSRTIGLESWLPIEILSVTITGTPAIPTATATRTQEYQKGGKDLFILPQANETGSANIWPAIPATTSVNSPLSFKQLFLELDKIHTLGMQLQGIPGNYVLRIEPLEYFFALPSNLRLDDIMNIKSHFESDKSYNMVQLDSGSAFGSITFGAANGPFAVVAGSNVLTGPTSALEVDMYIAIGDTGEVLKIEIILGSGSLQTYTNAVNNAPSTLVYSSEYKTVNNGPSELNANKGAFAEINCLGEILDLSNEFVTDIEVHGDQTSFAAQNYRKNLSASNEQALFCLLQCGDNQLFTKQYKYMVNDAGVIYERFAFNGHMTNHHKIINNYIKLKTDFYMNAGLHTQLAGQVLRYGNDATVRPSVIYEFESIISFSDMLSMVSNPQNTIEVDINKDGTHEKCWIYEVKMNINTKKAKFAVYTN